MMKALIGVLKSAVTISPCTLSGSLSATGAGATVTSTSRNITVPSGNTGLINIASLVVGSGSLEFSQNAGSFTLVAEGALTTVVNGDAMVFRGITMTAATSITFDIVDATTSTLIQSVTIART